MKYLKNNIAIAMFFALLQTSCDKTFEEPSPPSDPVNISANTSIRKLKQMHTYGKYEQITNDLIIEGIVSGDDKSGNLYKQICVQDSSAGITLLLDGSGLYAQYPVGRKIFIKCKGLWLSDYGRLIQLGVIDNSVPNNPSLTGIPTALFSNYIVKGSLGNDVEPKKVSINQLNDSLTSMLVQIDNVEFIAADTSRTYADTSANKSSVSLTIGECSGNKTTVYSSGYANFAGLKPAKGNGTITALYYVYKTNPELIIRDTSDVQFDNVRCNSSVAPVISSNGISLTNSPVMFDFNNIASGLPQGVYVKLSSTKTNIGTNGSFAAAKASWTATAAGFKNVSAINGLTSTSTQSAQDASLNRALAVRQTSATGYDPGTAFVFLLNNTIGVNNLKMDFILASCDDGIGRTTTWIVDYGVGENPQSFTSIATTPSALTTNGAFGSKNVSLNFGNVLNNLSQKVWIRIVSLNATTGSGSRAVSAIDDVKFSWN